MAAPNDSYQRCSATFSHVQQSQRFQQPSAMFSNLNGVQQPSAMFSNLNVFSNLQPYSKSSSVFSNIHLSWSVDPQVLWSMEP
jgi:hypothetical protein